MGCPLELGEGGHRVERAIQVRGAVHQDETAARLGHGVFACGSEGTGSPEENSIATERAAIAEANHPELERPGYKSGLTKSRIGVRTCL